VISEVQGRFSLCCEIVQNICTTSQQDLKKMEECITPSLIKVVTGKSWERYVVPPGSNFDM